MILISSFFAPFLTIRFSHICRIYSPVINRSTSNASASRVVFILPSMEFSIGTIALSISPFSTARIAEKIVEYSFISSRPCDHSIAACCEKVPLGPKYPNIRVKILSLF